MDVTRSVCWSPPGCHGGCGVLLYSKDGKLTKVIGDRNNRFNAGKLCIRGVKVTEMMYHPQRILYPMVRAGERGENIWRIVSWKEALSITAEKFNGIKKDFGAESVIFCKGTARDIAGWITRLCYGFGSPNYFGLGPANGNACYRPRTALAEVIIGGFPVPDLGQFEYSFQGGFKPPKCVIIWGANPIVTNPDGIYGGWINELMQAGTKVIVVDPRRTELVEKAKYWLQVKPGTDAALALGMINIILDRGKNDRKYCDEQIHGLDELRLICREYTLEKTSEITGIPPEYIENAAVCFSEQSPASIFWGVGVDMHRDSAGMIHSLIALMAITGNIGRPGGWVFPGNPFGVARRGDNLRDFPEIKRKPIGWEEYPMTATGNPYGQPDILLKQMETGRPYPIKGAWIQGAGIVPSGFAEPEKAIKLFRDLDFNVFTDIFINPAISAFGDIVFPAAMYPEKDSIYVHNSQLGAINKAVEPAGECKSDAEINLLMGRLIASEYFPWEDVRGWIDCRLKPAGMNFEELKNKGSIIPAITDAFFPYPYSTPTGKIELYSTVMEKMCLPALPYYENPYEILSRDELAKYPFILTTGARKKYYFGAEHRQSESLRKLQTEPEVTIHPSVAELKGIVTGERIRIFSAYGQCYMKARISDRYKPNVVHCDSGWWYPERDGAEPELFGLREANVNNLFPNGLQGRSGLGFPFRSFICNIEKV